jgi:outer membrane lipoprotein SlyB
MTHARLLMAAVVVTLLSGCAAFDQGYGAYVREQASRERTVQTGHVESVQDVRPDRVRTVMVKLDDGGVVAIVQDAEETFRPGDRVRILSDGATSRVTR